jgi:hypothetical protein
VEESGTHEGGSMELKGIGPVAGGWEGFHNEEDLRASIVRTNKERKQAN